MAAGPQWRKDVDACCAANKNEPFERAMKQLAPKAWLRGVRRQQAETRRSVPFVEWSKRYNCYAVSPLLNWSSNTACSGVGDDGRNADRSAT